MLDLWKMKAFTIISETLRWDSYIVHITLMSCTAYTAKNVHYLGLFGFCLFIDFFIYN